MTKARFAPWAGCRSLRGARPGKTWFGPVYFRKETEPYMTIAVPIERFAVDVIGVLQAEVNLKYIGDVVAANLLALRKRAAGVYNVSFTLSVYLKTPFASFIQVQIDDISITVPRRISRKHSRSRSNTTTVSLSE